MLLADTYPIAPEVLLVSLAATGAAGLVIVRKRIDQPTLLYLLAPIPLFALFTWLAVVVFDPDGDSLKAFDFLALQIVALGLGIAHVIFFYREVAGWRALDWPVRSSVWSWQHFGFACLLLFAGCIGVMLADVLQFTNVENGWNYFLALLTFLVPFIWVKALDQYMTIPQAVYRPWYPTLDYFTYEPHEKFPKATIHIVLDDVEADIADVPFDPNKPFEQVYRWVLHTYLQDQPDTYYVEKDHEVNVWGWHFHRARTGWFRWNKRIDPQRTFRKGRLRNGDIIIALRDPQLEHIDVVRAEAQKRQDPGTSKMDRV